MNTYEQLDAWIDAHFDAQVAFLQALIRVPTDTPPGNNAPHAERTAELLEAFGFIAEKHAVPAADVQLIVSDVGTRHERRDHRDAVRAVRPRRGGDVVEGSCVEQQRLSAAAIVVRRGGQGDYIAIARASRRNCSGEAPGHAVLIPEVAHFER